MRRITTKEIVTVALFMAMTIVMTLLIRIPTFRGYINLGDMVLLFAAHIVFSRLGNKQIQPRVLESQEEVHAEPVQTTRLEAQQPAQPSVTDELVQYKKLLDAGIITQEEFDAKKKQILGL